MSEKAVTIQLRRGTEQSEYRLPYQDGMNALSALKTIYEDYDRTIAYPMCLCRAGRCGACAMKINGKAVLGCNARLEAGEHYVFEPVQDKNVIRDLVCS